MDKIVRDFGEFIREKRIARGLSQSEMAKLLDISQAAYSRYESGNRDPGLNMVRKISAVLLAERGGFEPLKCLVCCCLVLVGVAWETLKFQQIAV